MKICKFCESENTSSRTVCSSCGANEFKHKCDNCGTVFEDGNFCRECGVKAGAKAKKCPDCGAEYYSAACPDCGYANNVGKAAAVYANTAYQPVKKRRTWLWVLGWIFVFPVPITILMVRNKKINKWAKMGIIAVAWVLYMIIAFAGNGFTGETRIISNNQGIAEGIQQEAELKTNTESTSLNSENISGKQNTASKESTIEGLVSRFNAVSDDKLEYVEDFVVSSKDSGHYRTEFRLNAYSDAVGKSYKLGEQIVDIISSQSILGDIDVRIYTDGATLDECKELVQYASKILDPTITDTTIADTIAYMEDEKEANGYYYGKLGLLLDGNDTDGYNLMIKT